MRNLKVLVAPTRTLNEPDVQPRGTPDRVALRVSEALARANTATALLT